MIDAATAGTSVNEGAELINTKVTQRYMRKSIVTCTGGSRDEMIGSSSDDWILLALLLHPLSITFNHNAIAIPHTFQSLHTNPLSLFPLVSIMTF
jgi:hypothetical protein